MQQRGVKVHRDGWGKFWYRTVMVIYKNWKVLFVLSNSGRIK